MSRELQIFKIIIIYAFLSFIDNKKLKKDNGADDDIYTCMFNYYLCDFLNYR
jgi:hypothetical protein